MNLAVAALEDPPVGSGVAEVAMPLDEGAVRLDHLEDVGAAACEGHGCCLRVCEGRFPEGGCLGGAMREPRGPDPNRVREVQMKRTVVKKESK